MPMRKNIEEYLRIKMQDYMELYKKEELPTYNQLSKHYGHPFRMYVKGEEGFNKYKDKFIVRRTKIQPFYEPDGDPYAIKDNIEAICACIACESLTPDKAMSLAGIMRYTEDKRIDNSN